MGEDFLIQLLRIFAGVVLTLSSLPWLTIVVGGCCSLKEEKTQSRTAAHFLILIFSIDSPLSTTPKPAGKKKKVKNIVHLPVNPEKHILTPQ